MANSVFGNNSLMHIQRVLILLYNCMMMMMMMMTIMMNGFCIVLHDLESWLTESTVKQPKVEQK